MTPDNIDDLLEQSEEGVWLIKNETHLNKWVRESKRLDHDRGLVPLAQSHIVRGTIAIDVGAFIGDHAIAYLESVGPDGLCVAYEPHPVSCECLRRNCPRAVTFQCAVGDKVGPTLLTPLLDNVGMSFTGPEGKLEVNLTTLDHDFSQILEPLAWKPVSFIKIDVEGREIEVLRGATKLITQYRPVIIFEINKTCMARAAHTNLELIQFMAEHGYITEVIPRGFNWDSEMADILCVHEK